MSILVCVGVCMWMHACEHMHMYVVCMAIHADIRMVRITFQAVLQNT